MFGELLKKYRKQKGFTQVKLADRLSDLLSTEIKQINVSSWEQGVNPKIEIIEAIAEILDIPVQYLFDDSDEVINKIVANKAPQLKTMVEHTLKIPLYDGYVGAGSGGIVDELNIKDYLYIDYLSIEKKYSKKPIVAFTVAGDSMEPYVYDGDIILFHPIVPGSNFNFVDNKYVIQNHNGLMVKNLTFRANGDIVISSCNKAYRDEIIKADETQELLEILGVVVGRILKS